MMGELFASFGLAMLTGVVCIYIVLVLLFGLPAARDHPRGPCHCRWAGPSWRCSSPARRFHAVPIGLIMLMGIATRTPSCWWNTPSSRAAPAWSGCMRC